MQKPNVPTFPLAEIRLALPKATTLLIFTATLIYTLLIVNWSRHEGRLSMDPTHDDVLYLRTGLSTLRDAYQHGGTSLLDNLFFIQNRSPVENIQVTLAFGIFGIHESSPYYLNAATLLIFTWFTATLLGAKNGKLSVLIFLGFAQAPLFRHSIHELRPDFACACFTAIAATIILSTAWAKTSTKHALLSATLVALALLSKPTVFAHTIAIVIVAILLSSIVLFTTHEQNLKKSLIHAFRLLIYVFVPALLLSLVYWWNNFGPIWAYFIENTRTGIGAQIWHIDGTYLEVMRKVMLTGEIGKVLGNYLLLALGGTALSIFFIAKERRKNALIYTLSIGILAMASVTIITFGRHNNMFLGFTFQLLFIILLTFTVACIQNKHLPATICTSILLLGQAPFFSTNQQQIWNKDENSQNLKSVNRQIVDSIEKNRNQSSSHVPVYVTFSGPVSADSMNWISEKNQLPILFSDSHRSSDVNEHWNLMSVNDYAVVANETSGGIYPWLPSTTVQDQLMQRIQQDSRFTLVATIPTTGSPIAIYRNNQGASYPSEGFTESLNWEGLMAEEGPYPKWNLPVVRWGTFPSTKIRANDASAKHLTIMARGDNAKSLSIWMANELLGTFDLDRASFRRIEQSIPESPSMDAIELKYIARDGIENIRAVLFRSILLDPIAQPHESQDL